ncbi:uncharacterized protein LOC115448369 [Manduca sexta]|uniref:uncharacterized protein LOC115448369 n=1 Tax=Manduca sexta TaxID=7130 RepID=UPI001183FECB|nr:uncharacterized protein LOC115448369 [Manduca sexta]
MSCNYKWSSEHDEILIGFVRTHEAIYNIKSKEYRKTHLKQNLWRQIGKILNKTDTDCSKRWCYIRDYYIRRRGKPGTGSSGEAAKKRSDLLSFLDSFPSSQRSSITNVKDENREDSIIMENTYDNSAGTQNPEDISIIMENTHNTSEGTQSNTQEVKYFICDNNNNKKEMNTKSHKKRKNNAHAEERLNLVRQIVNRNSTPTELDETELFFSSIAKIVKKLPRYEQVQLRMQIGSLVGNAELRHISNDSPQSSTFSAQPPRSSTSNSDC